MGDVLRVCSNLRKAKFVYAKTMPHIPHYYTVGKNWDSHEEFIWTATYIFEHGLPQIFFKNQTEPRNYYYYQGWRYWIMDKKPEDAAIINRERERIREPRWSKY